MRMVRIRVGRSTSRSRSGGLVVGLIAATMTLALVGSQPAVADPSDDKARVDRQLDQASAHLEAATERAQQAASSYAAAVALLPGARSALADAQGRVAAAEAGLRQIRREAERARADEAAADRQYADAAALVDAARAGVSEFAAATYRGGDLQLLDSLVGAGSPNEFAVRIGYLDKIAASRQRAVTALTAARGQARERRSVVVAAGRRVLDAATAAEQAVDTSRAAADAARQADDRVRALVAEREDALRTADGERQAVLDRYNELKAESARIAAELQAAVARGTRASAAGGGAGGPAVGAAGGFFLMPARGHKTSDFGMRFHPLFRSWILHTGLDIGAGTGAPIVAAADGEVINAGWRGGYGNYTCVLHGTYQGQGLATCYGHQSQILVHPGQEVRRGEVIGRVGSTGNSTGPHLHFEVRVAGSPVNPEKWLPACLC